MFNAIRMDIYRLIHTKSTYVILVFTILLAIITTGATALLIDMADAADEGVRIADTIISDFSGLDVALLLAIFTVIFSTADINSGYIKSVGGQVRNRGVLLISKMTVFAVFTLIAFIVDAITQCIAVPLLIHGSKFGNVAEMFKIAGVQYILNLSLAFFIMSIAIMIKNNVISMIIAVCMCTGLLGMIFNGINMLISRAGVENFDINNYIIISKITSIGMDATGKDIGSAIVVALIWAAVGLVGVYNVFKRRDI